MNASTVRVEFNCRLGWEIHLPEVCEPVRCTSLEEAQRVAYLRAWRRRPCELVVCDAYHRVLHRELITIDGGTVIDIERGAAMASTVQGADPTTERPDLLTAAAAV